MILTLFLQGELRSKSVVFFITGFLICHSFLDFLYIGVLYHHGEIVYPAANNSLFHFLFNTGNGYAVGWGDNGGRSPLCENCTDLYFPLFEKEIEMDFSGMVECSDQVHSNERTNK